MRIPPLLLAVALLAGCADSPFTPSESREALRALARWEARPFGDYAFEYRNACFCPVEVTQWSRVEVRQGAVVAVRSVESGALLDAELYPMWPTVEELFDRLLQHREDSDYLDDISAEFDAALGYPSYMNFRYDEGIMDAGATHYVRNLVPLS